MWATCEAKALNSPERNPVRSAAALVGTRAHELVTGVSFSDWPSSVTFDAITPVTSHLEVQAKAIAATATDLLTEAGWKVVEAEKQVERDGLIGRLDLFAFHPVHGDAVIDLKTGQNVGAAWLQVGGYLHLAAAGEFGASRWGGVLHVPRRKVHAEAKGTLTFRNADDLMDAFGALHRRARDVMSGAEPLRSPGQQCVRCQAQCPVRMG